MNPSKVAVLGSGAWGTALAKVLADQGHPVFLWSRRADLCEEINAHHENQRYLPGVRLPDGLRAESNLADSLRGASMVLFVAPSHATREVAQAAAPHIGADALIVSATKGIENDSLMFMDEVLADELPGKLRKNFAFLSGPSFAKELAQGLPTAVVVAARSTEVAARVMKAFHTPFLRLYSSDDVVGVECGGALKNVIAIAAGAMDGMGFGHNTRAALITRGVAEVARLSLARGGQALTLAGLAGMGDLVLTCTGELSRNRTVGVLLGKGGTLKDILANLGHVAEGVRTTKSAFDLSLKLGIDMPITRETYAVIYENKPVARAVSDLMSRELTAEFDARG